jgi:acyl-CoA reductase-like NAD-dependent aldehyde dehydrogenase
MSMKSTKKKFKVIKNLKFKIKYDSNNSINLKIENLHKNQALLDKLQSRLKILKSLKSFLIAKKTDLTNLIKSESLKTYDESVGEFDYALEFINYLFEIVRAGFCNDSL